LELRSMDEGHEYVHASPQIPLEDEQAALAFCRALAKALGQSPTGGTGPRSGNVSGASSAPPPEVSVVLPVYNEHENLPALYDRLTTVLNGQGISYELVFVDDGSGDGSAALVQALAAADPHVALIELARNFGQQVAISAGLDFSHGRAVVIMDADLQDPPELLPDLIAAWRAGNDVVYGIRTKRKESWAMRTAYDLFYRLLRRVANVEIPLDAGDLCIMDRRVVDTLCSMPERNRFVRGLRSWVGLRQVGLPYEREARLSGRPKYTYARLVLLALDGLVSFSHVPLRLASLLGFAISLLSFGFAAFYFVKKLTRGLTPAGFPTLIVAILFLAGIQLTTVGLLGEYVGRMFDEVKRRPLYVVRRVIRG
jgi:glycosyltransferase involved in cell wall biosynthesis